MLLLLPLLQELRAMVIRGPFVHPGAVAVEDEFGRVVSLAHTSKRVSMIVPVLRPRVIPPSACVCCSCVCPAVAMSEIQVSCEHEWFYCWLGCLAEES